MKLEEFVSLLSSVKSTGPGKYQAKCPAHDDKIQSLSVMQGEKGIVTFCHAGCTNLKICESLNIKQKDQFMDSDGNPHYAIEKHYHYTDEKGENLYRVERRFPKGAFKVEASIDGEWIPGLNGKKKVLYNLQNVITSDTVIICEGEKDCDALNDLGYCATTNPMGAGKWNADFSNYLKDKIVYIIPDNDLPGYNHLNDILTKTKDIAKELIPIFLDVKQKGDVSDWFECGHSHEEFEEVLAKAKPWTGKKIKYVEKTRCEMILEKLSSKPSENELNETLKQWLEESNKEGRNAVSISRAKTILKDKKVTGASQLISDLIKADNEKNKVEIESDIFGFSCEPCNEEINGNDLLLEIESVLRKYVAMKQYCYETVSLWILYTYAYDLYYISPYILIRSPIKRCGKSTLLTLISKMCRAGLMAHNITAAVIFRIMEDYHPVLCLDEADTWLKGDHEEIRGIINSGFEAEGSTMRCEGDENKVRKYSTFGPKAIASIGKLQSTIEDRSIVIMMDRRAPNEKVEKLHYDKLLELKKIKSKCTKWANDNTERLNLWRAFVPDLNNDRAEDCWRALITLADFIGGKWSDIVREAAKVLSIQDDDQGVKITLLTRIREIYNESGYTKMFTKSLIEKLKSDDTAPWADWNGGKGITAPGLVKILNDFYVKPKMLRIGIETARGYEIESFRQAFEKYLPKAEIGNGKIVVESEYQENFLTLFEDKN